MTYGMFVILCLLIIACGHREPKKKGILDDIDTREPADYDRIKNYGKPAKPKETK
jgi:hypothetical protein